MAPTSMVVLRVRAPADRSGVDIVDIVDTAPVLPLVADAVALPPPVTLTAVASPLRPDRPLAPAPPRRQAGSLTRPKAATALVGPSRLTEMATAQKHGDATAVDVDDRRPDHGLHVAGDESFAPHPLRAVSLGGGAGGATGRPHHPSGTGEESFGTVTSGTVAAGTMTRC